MISLLTDVLPDTVELCGQEVPIETDYRTYIRFEQLLANKTINDTVRTNTAIAMCFGGIALDRAAAIRGILWFYSCGTYDPDAAPKKRKNEQKIYDYAFDGKLIYAAMLDQYRIDLQDIDGMHWWKFCALQSGLKADNEFVRVMSYRALDLSQIKDRKMRARYAKYKALYALPDMRTHEEKIASAGAAFGRGWNDGG